MAWGTLQVGRLYLRETYDLSYQVNATTGEQSVSVEGIETAPPWTVAQLEAASHDLASLLDQDIPVVFSSKSDQTGFYRVTDVGSKETKWVEATSLPWTLSLQRIGAENAVDFESRLGSVVRQNNFSLTGERWHAPAVGAYGYFTGTTPPGGSVARVLADAEGSLTAFRSLPAGVNPVWGITAPNYLKGRSRFLVDGYERSGIGFRVASTNWVLTNGLIRVSALAAGGTLKIEGWDGAAWSTHDFDVTVGSDLAPPFNAVTVVRNDLECVVIRLVKDKASGRILIDLTLRRGAVYVEGFIQTDASATLGVKTHAAVTTTNNAASGYIVETANDAQGNKLTIGVPVTFTGSTTGGVSLAASTQLPFYVGYVIDGSTAVSGNAATDIRNQYIGMPSEQTLAVKR